MTTGRINQVATIRVTPEPPGGGPARCSLVCVEFELRPCISFAIVLYHCSAPASVSRNFLLEEATPPGERAQLHQRHGVRPLLGTPPSCASRCVELLVFEWTVEATTIDPYNSKTRVQVIQSPDERCSVFECKKRKANPEVRKSKICSMPPRSGKPATPRG